MLALSLAVLALVAQGAVASRISPASWYLRPGQYESKLCVDISGANYNDWTPIQLWDCNGSDAQRFSRNYNVDETLWQAYRHYEYCMQADGLYNGAKVFLRKCPKGITSRTYTTQQIKGTGASYVWDETKYRVGGTNFCLDVTDGKMEKGNQLQLWECHDESHPDHKNQLFFTLNPNVVPV